MREPKKQKIGDVTYVVTMLPPMKAHRLLMRALKGLGPTLGPVLTSIRSVSDLMNLAKTAVDSANGDFAWVDSALVKLCDGLDVDLLDEIIQELAAQTVVIGKAQAPLKECFDAHFAGELLNMYRWLWLAWSAQFSDFSDTLTTKLKTAEVKV